MSTDIDTDKRIFVCGITGSGKTTFASKIYEELDTLCIFINTNMEQIPEQASEVIVRDVDSCIEAINEGYTKICYNPREHQDITPEEIDQLRRVLFNMGVKFNARRKEPVVFAHMFIDEIQEYSSLHKPHAGIDRIWKRGRRYGVVGVSMSQRPADVSHTILTQSQYHIIFKLGTYEIPYFERYHIPIEEHQEWLNKDYHFIVFDGLEVTRYYPIEVD